MCCDVADLESEPGLTLSLFPLFPQLMSGCLYLLSLLYMPNTAEKDV